jgi:hypothetical protein
MRTMRFKCKYRYAAAVVKVKLSSSVSSWGSASELIAKDKRVGYARLSYATQLSGKATSNEHRR